MKDSNDPRANTETVTAQNNYCGKYLLKECVGRGGYGTVYLSSHPELEIPVAVKVLRTKMLDGNVSYIKRFLREAKIAARINHPNIVRVFDAGAEDGTYFTVMEYLDSGTVADQIREKGKLSVEQTLDISLDMTKALEAAYDSGIVHRDVKPDNIMLTQYGAAKLADFGLVKKVTCLDGQQLTSTGVGFGTPWYVAPEQASEPNGCDIRGDIYSLGASMYHMLTGNPPFKGETVCETLQKHISEPLVSPSEVNPQIPDNISRVICCMMQKAREERYQMPKELHEALLQCQEKRRGQHHCEGAVVATGRNSLVRSLVLACFGTLLLIALLVWFVSSFLFNG